MPVCCHFIDLDFKILQLLKFVFTFYLYIATKRTRTSRCWLTLSERKKDDLLPPKNTVVLETAAIKPLRL